MMFFASFKVSVHMLSSRWLLALPVVASVLLTACSSQPRVPDWQLNAKAASDRFVEAELTGNARVATLELSRARQELSATGRADLLARLELLACATRQASLDFSACTAFAPLQSQAAPAERAYADYLAGQLEPTSIDQLPEQQRMLALRLAQLGLAQAASGRALASASAPVLAPVPVPDLISALESIDEPLSRMVASAVLVRAGQASPAVLELAIRTASEQGWRKPLLAWLGLAAQRADQSGRAQEAARLRARMALVAPLRAQSASPATPATPARAP